MEQGVFEDFQLLDYYSIVSPVVEHIKNLVLVCGRCSNLVLGHYLRMMKLWSRSLLTTLCLRSVYLIIQENDEEEDLPWKDNVEKTEVDHVLIAWKSECGYSSTDQEYSRLSYGRMIGNDCL